MCPGDDGHHPHPHTHLAMIKTGPCRSPFPHKWHLLKDGAAAFRRGTFSLQSASIEEASDGNSFKYSHRHELSTFPLAGKSLFHFQPFCGDVHIDDGSNVCWASPRKHSNPLFSHFHSRFQIYFWLELQNHQSSVSLSSE